AESVADLTLDVIEEQLREEILCVPHAILSTFFKGGTCLKQGNARALINSFANQGQFLPRDQAERNQELVQAIPTVIIRNKTGEILRLRRKEATESNPLHEKLVIWAGGHVRVEDGRNGQAVLRCAVRE